MAYALGLGTAAVMWGAVLAIFFLVSHVAALVVGLAGLLASLVLGFVVFRNDPG